MPQAPNFATPNPWIAPGARRDGPVPDQGSLALMLAIITVGILALAGLVIDGGAMLAERGRAADLAEQAARAGASAITPASLRGPSPADLRIDPGAAQRAA